MICKRAAKQEPDQAGGSALTTTAYLEYILGDGQGRYEASFVENHRFLRERVSVNAHGYRCHAAVKRCVPALHCTSGVGNAWSRPKCSHSNLHNKYTHTRTHRHNASSRARLYAMSSRESSNKYTNTNTNTERDRGRERERQ